MEESDLALLKEIFSERFDRLEQRLDRADQRGIQVYSLTLSPQISQACPREN